MKIGVKTPHGIWTEIDKAVKIIFITKKNKRLIPILGLYQWAFLYVERSSVRKSSFISTLSLKWKNPVEKVKIAHIKPIKRAYLNLE